MLTIAGPQSRYCDGISRRSWLKIGGLAMGAAGSDVAINSASVALMNNDLSRLPFLIRLSRKPVSEVHRQVVDDALELRHAEA